MTDAAYQMTVSDIKGRPTCVMKLLDTCNLCQGKDIHLLRHHSRLFQLNIHKSLGLV